MPTINGPKLQAPAALARWIEVIQGPGGEITSINPTQEAMQFFHVSQQISFNLSRSGPTGSRPTSKLDGRWIGMPYFDTDLGLEIWLKSVNPDVWVNGAGVVV